MKIGKLMTTNSKGQLVIPQDYRELLGITPEIVLNVTLEKTGLFIQPIQNVIPKITSENMYSQILQKTAGAWKGDSFDQTRKKRKKIELDASKMRKQPW